MQNILDDALSPFYGLNMANLYSKYGQFIDGLIFFTIFLGLSQHVFGKHFSGNKGKAVSIAFSFLLTIAFLVWERQFNFNLKSFGGLAVGVIILLTGYFMMTVLRSFGLKTVPAFTITYSLVYLSIATAIPNLFDYIATRARWLNGLLGLIFLISLLISVYMILRFIFTGRHMLPDKLTSLETGNPEREARTEDKEIEILKETRLKIRTITHMMDALAHIEKLIESGNLDEATTSKIRAHLHHMSNQEQLFRQSYNNLNLRFKQLGGIDAKRLKDLEADLMNAPEGKRHIKQAELDIERQKVEYNEKIIEMKEKLDNHIKGFNQLMQAAIQNLSIDQIHQAKDVLLNLKRISDAMEHMTREVINLHRMQRDLFKSERRKRR